MYAPLGTEARVHPDESRHESLFDRRPGRTKRMVVTFCHDSTGPTPPAAGSKVVTIARNPPTVHKFAALMPLTAEGSTTVIPLQSAVTTAPS
jgi:hypothetical protein